MQISRIIAVVLFMGSTTLAAPVAEPNPNPAVYNPWEHIRAGTKPVASSKKRQINYPKGTNLLPDIIRPTAAQEREDRRRVKREDPPAVAPAPAPVVAPPVAAPAEPVAEEVSAKKTAATFKAAAKTAPPGAKGVKPGALKLGGVTKPDLPGRVRRRNGEEKRDRRFKPGSFPPRKNINATPDRI
ncbi:hypothetical protein TWF569_011758 [Orbilia oligospora]|uniref:Uncharacterized protein n=1 Tax=Orbilia oligospora TaxID=2813651 RepID=A0A7C8NGG2_ORBOL|nr:hypothetical protein TWF102_004451 [Orbilia oligospora]KAF3103764.1 hypothetical protein TWF706_004806 [Orbilia oligospora]KAF3110349.1 hypothetical protein TWF103_004639 [Orbilia oligospora]KAF3122502.1 hypothetical protein TWF594_002795 [Orbilia oligospora]KAF3127393.1 hypothetical protein TWF569_011758 [Orbilia oligospora]